MFNQSGTNRKKKKGKREKPCSWVEETHASRRHVMTHDVTHASSRFLTSTGIHTLLTNGQTSG